MNRLALLSMLCFAAAPARADCTLGLNCATTNSVTAATTSAMASVVAYQDVAPASGSTVTMSAGVSVLVVKGTALLATLTTRLPPTPADGQIVRIASQVSITSLAVQDAAGNAVASGISVTGFAAGNLFQWQSTGWVRLA